MPILHTYDNYDENYYWNAYNNGINISSSGTSGSPKQYYNSPEKIQASCPYTIDAQTLTKDSKVYTVARPTHASGLFSQTMPALVVGADVYLTKFDPYMFVKEIQNYTHTSLTPLHCKGIMSTKNFDKLDLSGIFVSVGGEPVTYDIIEAFVSRGARFQVTWGMSEVMPGAIYEIITNEDDIKRLKEITPPNASIIGSNIVKDLDYKISNTNLFVKGKVTVYDEWYDTKDQVIENNGTLFFTGREGTPVDFNKPRKG